MSRRFTVALAWSLWALAVVSTALQVLLVVQNWQVAPPAARYPTEGTEFAFNLAFLSYPSVGALIASRRPRNPVGWLFLAFGLAGALIGVSGAYAFYAIYTRPGLPGGDVAALLADDRVKPGAIGLLIFVLLLFPSGRLPSPRWRPIARVMAIGFVLAEAAGLFAGGPLRGWSDRVDPFGLPWVPGASVELAFLSTPVNLFVAAASVIVRYRSASGDERQQLKWITLATALLAVVLGVIIALTLAGADTNVLRPLNLIGFASIPVAAAIAILRYRLYDIDLIINRTLVYGALSATLGAAYFGGIVLLQFVLRPFTAGSELAVAGSTLAVAALFQPLRRRIQQAVDRRFYRRRYDAATTLDAFSSRLRSQIDLDTLEHELLGVVRDTMQPAHASLWLRERPR